MTYKGYLIDLDGTIYKGKDRIPAGEAFVHELQKREIPYLFVTNNTTRTPESVQEMLANQFNIDTPVSTIYTATLAIHKGAHFIGTNPDLNIPTERGLLPGAGSLITLLEAATRVKPVYIGKPNAIIMDKVLNT